MKKTRLFSLLALLLLAASESWGQSHTYTVAGSSSEMFGNAWDATYTANDMTLGADGTYSITYTDVSLSDDVQYQVVEDHGWTVAYPEGNRVITINSEGTYTFTIHFNPSTGQVYETTPSDAPQVPNGDFELWTYDGENLPNGWNSPQTSDGNLGTMYGGVRMKRSTVVRPGSAGQYSCCIYPKKVMTVMCEGILTSGRVHYASMSASNSSNYNYTHRAGSNTKNNVTNPCSMPFTGRPVAVKVWVRYVQGGTGYGDYATAKFSAIIHSDADYIAYNLPEHDNNANKALVVASASQEIEYKNGQWEELTIPFEYTDNDVEPAYILINAYTNAYPGKSKDNDSLYIDDIELVYEPAVYSIAVAGGTEDAGHWTLDTTAFEAGATITATYTGDRKVKNVKVVKVPKDVVRSRFTVNAKGDQVYFSKGNLQATTTNLGSSWTWGFAEHQWSYVGNTAANTTITNNGTVSDNGTVDLFGWSTTGTTYGIHNSSSASDYDGDYVDWGTVMGEGWYTLTKVEWTYLFQTRSASTVGSTDNARFAKAKVNDVSGVILFPDTYTHPSDVTVPTNINSLDAGYGSNNYASEAWAQMEASGCVFLPAANSRSGNDVIGNDENGLYWSSTDDQGYALQIAFGPRNFVFDDAMTRDWGLSVRLVYSPR